VSGLRGRDPVAVAILCCVIAYQVALAWFVYGYSYFTGDDFSHFASARTRSLWENVFLFIDVHFAPLHRAVSWSLQHFFPMSWTAAVVFMFGVHGLTLLSLFRLLGYLTPGRHPHFWLLVYATNLYLIVLLIWWSSALHRLPYLLFCVVALNQSVRWADRGGWRHFFGAQLACAAALGFFAKGVLIPAYVLGLEVCRLVLPPRPVCAPPPVVVAAPVVLPPPVWVGPPCGHIVVRHRHRCW